ncbi:uncharacterized protein [Porites lutea]|uniref:uncharacterized protein isoform X2 n=1 Tax=Porites lutea TaxID=51062 RepID=UPI003CC65EF7
MSSSIHEEILEAQSQGYTLLYLNYRKLSELPEELLSLSKIKKLYLKRNVLRKLPADIWRLGNLVELYLHSNNLHELPDELGNLTQLKDLNVINNKLEWLPWQLCNCASLNSLSFDGNAIRKIPRQLMRHQGLTDLYASGNKLSSLPQDVNQLSSLESLILDNNMNLQLLPATLLKMENLKIIGLSCIAVSSLSSSKEEHCSDLRQVLSLRYILDSHYSNVPPLTELCFRAVHSFVRSITDESLSSLLLPSDVTSLLSTPTGHCFICCNPYFTAAFPLKESAATALQVVKPSSLNLQRLREIQCTFVFCYCSIRCLREVCRMRDIPE